MKRLILILGPNGTGKSTAARELQRRLPRSAYVEPDSLRMFSDPSPDPAQPCDETVALRYANILSMTRNYLVSNIIDTVILPYGLHGYRKKLLANLISALRGEFELEILPVLFCCEPDENIRRMRADIRDEGRIARALDSARVTYERAGELFPGLLCVDVTNLSPEETVKLMADRFGDGRISHENMPS